MLGVSAEDAVCLADDETEGVENVLEAFDVSAVEIGHAKIEHAVAEHEGGVYQGSPCRLVDEITGRQALAAPELAHRDLGAVEIDAVDVEAVAKHTEALLHVLDSRPLAVALNGLHAARLA